MADTPRFLTDLDTLIRARYPLIYLVTWEEQRVDLMLADMARLHGKELLEWSATRGLRQVGAGNALKNIDLDGTRDPSLALQLVGKLPTPALVLLKDFHRQLEDGTVVRSLRELSFHLKSGFSTVLIVAPTLKIPDELEKEISVIDVPLPTRQELMDLLRGIARVVTRNKKAVVELNKEQAESLVAAAHGLTLAEAENAFAKAIARDARLDGDDVRMMIEEKSQIIRKSGLLEYQEATQSLDDIGGLTHLKHWLKRRQNAFTQSARDFGLPEPKGLMLLGVQGCGKSLTAKAIATAWKLPLIRLDMGRIYSGLVGSSEENLRRAIRITESLAPVVLWVDEIEKGLAGVGSNSGDSGVSARVFGTLLTWLQEKTAPAFVVATANRVDLLPAEMLRKGRFDDIFFVDLPTENERRDILSIVLKKRGRNAETFQLDALARATTSFSGAELEQVVIAAMYDAFADGSQLTDAYLMAAVGETVPLAVTMAEDVSRLRQWAKQRTRPAS